MRPARRRRRCWLLPPSAWRVQEQPAFTPLVLGEGDTLLSFLKRHNRIHVSQCHLGGARPAGSAPTQAQASHGLRARRPHCRGSSTIGRARGSPASAAAVSHRIAACGPFWNSRPVWSARRHGLRAARSTSYAWARSAERHGPTVSLAEVGARPHHPSLPAVARWPRRPPCRPSARPDRADRLRHSFFVIIAIVIQQQVAFDTPTECLTLAVLGRHEQIGPTLTSFWGHLVR
jgi:hypothetical protein